MKRAEEMTPLLETVESQHQSSHSFPQALGNLANTARFPHSLSSCDYDCTWKLITLTTGASRTRGLLSYLTQPTPVWVTSLNDLTGIHHLRGIQIGLALGGGAVRCMAHVGVLKALEQHGIYIDMLAGTSAGAMTGTIYAAGLDPEYATHVFKSDLKPSWLFRQ